jgi:hypothetical protein
MAEKIGGQDHGWSELRQSFEQKRKLWEKRSISVDGSIWLSGRSFQMKLIPRDTKTFTQKQS